MLSDSEYIRQGIGPVLIYTRALTEKSLNMEISFPTNNYEYMVKARNLRNAYTILFQRAVALSNKNILNRLLESGSIITEYTPVVEALTERLFGIETDEESTMIVQALEGGVPIPSLDIIEKVTSLLNDAKLLNMSFLVFLDELLGKVNNSEVFIFNFEMNMNNTYLKIEIYNNSINRILSKENLSPTYVAQLQYKLNQIMSIDAYLLGSYINQSEESLIKISRMLSNDIENLLPDYFLKLSPKLQQDLSNRSYNLVLDFISFLKDILEKIKKSEIQYIVGPIYFDNMLNEANFYKFVLEGSLDEFI